MSDPTHRPPRPSADGRTETEVRIDEIVDRMAAGRWVTGSSHRELAQAWHLSVSRIEELATEASRVIRRLVRGAGTRETLQAQMVMSIDALRIAAMQRTRKRLVQAKNGAPPMEVEELDPDFRSALDALKLKADLLGLHSPLAPTPWFEDPDRLAELRRLAAKPGDEDYVGPSREPDV